MDNGQLSRTRQYAYLLGILVGLSGCNLNLTRPDNLTPVDSLAEAARAENVPAPQGKAGNNDQPVERPTTEAQPPADLWERIRNGYRLPASSDHALATHTEWLTRSQAYLDRVAERARPYIYLIVEELERRDMPLELALLPVVESAYQPFAYSPGRAAGLWQIVPGTGRRFGLKQNWWYDGRRDVVASTTAALDYLQFLHREFDGDWLHAIAAYNCGEGNVSRAIRRNRRADKPTDFWHLKLPRETRGYVPRLLAVSRVVAHPEGHGLSLPPIPNEPYLAQVPTGSQIDLALAADLADVSLEELYRLNPGFNRWATDPDGPHRLVLPIAKAPRFDRALASLPEDKRVRWERHRIREGETLSHIAQRYRTTIQVLKEVNGLRGSRIRAGRSLTVPVATKSVRHYSLTSDARRQTIQSRARRGSKAIHVVRAGDSLWAIAERYSVSPKQLARWNAMAPRDILRPGQKLAIWGQPERQTVRPTAISGSPDVTGETNQRIRYRVKQGESLWRISRRFKVSIASLREWNSLPRDQHLQPGQTLEIFVDVTRQAESI